MRKIGRKIWRLVPCWMMVGVSFGLMMPVVNVTAEEKERFVVEERAIIGGADTEEMETDPVPQTVPAQSIPETPESEKSSGDGRQNLDKKPLERKESNQSQTTSKTKEANEITQEEELQENLQVSSNHVEFTWPGAGTKEEYKAEEYKKEEIKRQEEKEQTKANRQKEEEQTQTADIQGGQVESGKVQQETPWFLLAIGIVCGVGGILRIVYRLRIAYGKL